MIAGAVALALAAGALLGAAGSASATGTASPWVGTDPNEAGGIEFFNGAGTQITGGSLLDGPPLAAYAVGTTVLSATTLKATLYGYLPNPSTNPGTWSNLQLSTSSAYPNASAPGALATTPYPVQTGVAGDANIANLVEALPQTSSAAGYSGTYELRLKTTGGTGGNPTRYDYADITISNLTKDTNGVVTGGSWAVTYTPDPAGTATSTTIDASTPTTATDAAAVTLTADVSVSAPGTVQFSRGSTAIGSPVTVASGSASVTTTLPSGIQQIKAVFTPASLSGFAGSTSANYPIVVSHVVANTTVTPSHAFGSYTPNPDSSVPAYTSTTVTATVSPATAGSVTFLDNGASIGNAPVNGSGVGTLVYGNFGPGPHSITEAFTPTDSADFQPSVTDPADADNFTLGAAAGAVPDEQDISGSVPVGTLAISTPYNGSSSAALAAGSLGTLNVNLLLNAPGTELSGTAAFGNTTGVAGDPLADTIKVIDTRTGGANWVASAAASDLTNGTHTISAENVGLVGLTPDFLSGNHLQAGNVATDSNPAAGLAGSPAQLPVEPAGDGHSYGLGGGVAHAIANSNDPVDGGSGTVGFTGTLQITAPTSTAGGTYIGTVTFTVV
ncbi:Ig-like domain repeat protein [Jatrophihabitans sp.]|uniref:Ig-like domain repeat protein n=1 Tax=Jatrophihabitans sp. TaxID=1932789 RepID=UPI0030C77162